MTISRPALAAVLLAASLAAAQADDMAMPMGSGSAPADKAFMASMTRMNKSMGGPMSGDPDKDFASMMMPHHQGAIEMAEIELKYGKDPALRAMARDIVAAQKKEIAEMQAWQARHGK